METFILIQIISLIFFLVAYKERSEILWMLSSITSAQALSIIINNHNIYYLLTGEVITLILINALLLSLSLFYLSIDLIDKYATSKFFRRED